MIKVTLTKDDIISLLKGTTPPYQLITGDMFYDLGTLGGQSPEWKWDFKKLQAMTEHELWALYTTIKEW